MVWKGLKIACPDCGNYLRIKVECASAPKKTLAEGPYKADTPLRRVVLAFKIAKGFQADDRAWDRQFYAMNATLATRILNLLSQDAEKAIDCIADASEKFEKLGMKSWSLSAVLKFAPEWLQSKVSHAL